MVFNQTPEFVRIWRISCSIGLLLGTYKEFPDDEVLGQIAVKFSQIQEIIIFLFSDADFYDFYPK